MKFESMAFSSHEILSNRILGPWNANQYFPGAIKFQSIKFSGCEILTHRTLNLKFLSIGKPPCKSSYRGSVAKP